MHIALFFFFLFLPLVFFSGANQEFELPKYVFLLLSTALFTILRTYEFFFQQQEARLVRGQKIFLALLGVLIAFLILHTYTSISAYSSFWGSYERHQGLLFALVLAYLFWLIYTRKWTDTQLRTVATGVIAGGFLASFISLLQLLPVAYMPSFLYPTSQTLGRIFGTMGHPNFLGQYVMLSLGMHYYFLITHSSLSKNRTNLLLALSIFIHLVVLLFTGNRASIVAVVLVGMLVALTVIWNRRTKIWKMIFLTAIGLLVALIAFVWINKLGIEGFQRSITSRMHLYPAVLDAISARMWFGYGLDSFGYAFTPWFPTGMGETEAFMNIPDKAHNILLDTIFQVGVIGSIVLAALGMFFFRLLYSVKKHPLVQTCMILLASGGISYMAGFPTISDSILLVTISALAVSILSTASIPPMTQWWKVLLYGSLFPVLGYLGMSMFVADIYYKNAKNTPNEHNFLQTITIAPDPYEYIVYGSSMLRSKEDTKRFLQKISAINTADMMPQLQMLFLLSDVLTADEKKILRTQVASQCKNCPMVHYYMSYSFFKDMVKQDAIESAKKYMELLPSFVKKYLKEDQPLTLYEQERLRIFLKENQDYFPQMRELVEK